MKKKGVNKNMSFEADFFRTFWWGVVNKSWGLEYIDHGVGEEEVRASASNSSTDCYEGPCVSIHPTTL